MTQTTVSPATTPVSTSSQEEIDGGLNFKRIFIFAAATPIVIIVIIFIIGWAIAQPENVNDIADMVQTVRDIFIIIIAIQGIIIVVAFAVLVAQIARLVNLLQTETRPILDNAAAAAKSAKGTADFVGENVTEPIIKAGGFFAGLGVFLREFGGIRRALRRKDSNGKD